ncbi:hypothetical protein [Lacticaseibacillus daqingensis]|uniref:hypothetical protein n=1 Tax=Lacticaseibacillus daqingensis TaxID=2486014 RepID=UPI000F766344|nr:hypothetical protein [Lacticaseibacillus daqingensis]
MAELLGCLLEPLLGLLIAPHFDARYPRRSAVQLVVALLVNGTLAAMGGWLISQGFAPHDGWALGLGGLLLVLFGGLCCRLAWRYAQMWQLRRKSQ